MTPRLYFPTMSSSVIATLAPFCLEDFFDKYEHRTGLINLASSDARPWNAAELETKGVLVSDAKLDFRYPDALRALRPGLEEFCNPPAKMQLLPTAGAAEAIALVTHEIAASKALGQKRRIGIPWPCYGAFQGLAKLLGLEVERYLYDPSKDWAPDPADIAALATSCDAVVVTNPHNPTGRVMPRQVLEDTARALSVRGGLLIVDEVFRVHGELESAIKLGSDVVVIGSLSKTYGLPGLRLGWVATSHERLKRLRTIQQYLSLSLSTLTVALAVQVLKSPSDFSRASLIFANRSTLDRWTVAQAGRISVSPAQGGTTVCLTVNRKMDENALFKEFLNRGVLLVPGNLCFEFGSDFPWFRLGYAVEPERLSRGLELIGEVVASIA